MSKDYLKKSVAIKTQALPEMLPEEPYLFRRGKMRKGREGKTSNSQTP